MKQLTIEAVYHEISGIAADVRADHDSCDDYGITLLLYDDNSWSVAIQSDIPLCEPMPDVKYWATIRVSPADSEHDLRRAARDIVRSIITEIQLDIEHAEF